MDIRKIDSVSQLLQVRQEAAQAGKSLVYLGDRQVRVVDRGQISKTIIEATGQNDREVRRLNEFAASLRRSETGVPPGPELTLEQRAERLMGRTLKPEVAAHFLGAAIREGQETVGFQQRIGLDHKGTITSLPEDLSELELLDLEQGLTTALNRTNAAGDRTVARTESECVLEMLGAIRQAQKEPLADAELQMLRKAEQQLGALWLSGEMNSQSAASDLAQLGAALARSIPKVSESAKGTFETLHALSEALHQECLKDKQLSQRHDNTFGRMFESQVARQLVANPSPAMLQAAGRLNAFMLQTLTANTPQAQDHLADVIKNLKKDARPWLAEVPQVKAFLDNPSPETLQQALASPTNGWDMIATYWMAAKFSSTNDKSPWMPAANENYSQVVKANRSNQATALSAGGLHHVKGAGVQAVTAIREAIARLQADQVRSKVGVESALGRRIFMLSEIRSAIQTANAQGMGSEIQVPAIIEGIRKGLALLRDVDHAACDQLEEALAELTVTPEGAEAPTPETVGTFNPLGRPNIPEKFGSKGIQTSTYGTALPHQPLPDAPSNWQSADSVTAKSSVNLSAPTAFEQGTLENNQNTVNGVSGTTNMLTFLMLHLEKEGLLGQGDDAIQLGDALAGNLSFLVMDGGHSIPEAMATAASILADTSPVWNDAVKQHRQDALDAHVTRYGQMHDGLGRASTQEAVRDAVSLAFDHTVDRFQDLHQARQTEV